MTAAFVTALIATQVAILDACTRGTRWIAEPRALADIVTSVAILLALVVGATSPVRRAALAVVASALLVLEILVFRYYHVTLDIQVVASALHVKHEVLPVLWRATPGFLLAVGIVSALQYALLALVHRRLRARPPPHRWGHSAVLVVASLGGLFGMDPRRATPEIRAVHALAALRANPESRAADVRVKGSASSAIALPPLHADRAELPSILFILTESVRASEYRPGGDQPTAPDTAALTHGRTDLAQMRALSSYTALSLSSILTGRTQEAPRETILRAPSLFDFAHAARDARGRGSFVGYFSSQPSTVFETEGVRAAVDRFATVETIRGHDVEDDPDYADLPLDREIVDLFLKELPALPAASVLMLHVIGTHAPYFLDPERAPFQPYDHVVTWAGMPKLLNAYRDSIYEQDRTLSRALRAFIEHSGRRPWLVVFTSDHGEAFGENGGIHHGSNLMDEQVHVPAWVASGNGALTSAQERALEDHAGRFLTHLDLLPTLLDAMGLWDNLGVAPHRAAMPGKSILRPHEMRSPIPVTNCTGMFPCPLNTWGLLAEDRKLVSRVWDGGWYCLALGGPEERVVEGADPACDRLRAASQRTFPLLPNGSPNR